MIRKTWTVMWAVMLIGIFLATAAECRGADDPAKVTETFWKAVKSGGTKAARLYVTKASQAAIDKGTLNLKGGTGNILIGETKIQGNKATVIVKNADKPDEQFTTVLMMEDGEWKVDPMQTMQGMLGGSDLEKQMQEMQKKLLEGMTTAMKDVMAIPSHTAMAAADGDIAKAMADAMAKAMAATGAAKKPSEEAMFLLVDMGWGDPFLHPSDRSKGEIEPEDIIPELGDEKKKIWEDALSALKVDVIIGFEDDLAAVVSGVRIRPGDTIIGEKLKFKVEKITSNAVYLRCISEEKDYEKFLGIKVERRIIL